MSHAASTLHPQTRDADAIVADGWRHVQDGNWPRAQACFEAAERAQRANPGALTGLGVVHLALGQLREAVLRCDAAIAHHPDYAPAWLQRGFILSAGGSTRAAEACFDAVLVHDPGNGDALAALSGIRSRAGEHDAARILAIAALDADPGNAVALCTLAACDVDAGEAATAVARLTPLASDTIPPSEQQATVHTLLGNAYHQLGQTDAAFAAYVDANATFLAAHADKIATRNETHTAFMHQLNDAVAAVEPRDWALPEDGRGSDPFCNHVFLLGYPRSGTTLVENILASLPGVVALEERPTLREADQAFLADGGIARLAALTRDGALPYRAAYWGRVAAATGQHSGTTFVDMDPLKGVRLPLIARLFPRARIVLMRRDPRDCVLSCFRTNFALTAAAIDFATLEGAARHYDALMTLTETSLARLPLTVHILRYDALVQDFDATTAALCGFLDLTWSPELRDFFKTAQRRGVATASDAQVRKPLYDGTRQWERYRKQLDPVLPILAPWVDRYGFGA